MQTDSGRRSPGGQALLLALLLQTASFASLSMETNPGPATIDFEPTPCRLPGVPAAQEDRLRCGYVRVPRNYQKPSAGTFRLHVAILGSGRHPAEPEPIVLHSGGPGVAGSAIAALLLQEPAGPARDVVLVDDRGTGLSDPGICRDITAKHVRVLAADLALEDFIASARQYLRDCRQEMQETGISPTDFGTSITVEDMDRVRQALGIGKWNLHGVSYGTRVALDYMARHPEALRSVVLDSVMHPPGTVFKSRPGFEAALGGVTEACNLDSSCSKEYPDLAATFKGAQAALEKKPVAVRLPSNLGIPGNQVILNRADLEWILLHMLYHRGRHGQIPGFLAAAHRGDAGALQPAVQQHVVEWMSRPTSMLTYAAVMCRDTEERDPIVASFGFQLLELGDFCLQWSEPGQAPELPRQAPVPTLVLSGENDPVTPPNFARLVVQELGSLARWIRFPQVGHGVTAQSPCARELMFAFLERPSGPLDASCALPDTMKVFD